MSLRRVGVVGGGISGLTAALDLAEAGCEVTVFEPASLGGKVAFVEHGVSRLPTGPDAFLARRPEMIDLAERLGLGEELVAPQAGQARIFRDGRLHPIPPSVLGVPREVDSLRSSDLLDDRAVTRAAEDLDAAADRPAHDESVGALVRRRLGDDVLEWLVDPLLGGINAGDSDRLSVRSGVPQIDALASRNASLIRSADEMGSAVATDAPVFLTPEGGLHRLLDALDQRLRSLGVGFSPTGVDACVRTGVGWSIATPRGRHDVDAVLTTTPAPVTAGLFDEATLADAGAALRAIEYSSVALILLEVDLGEAPVEPSMSGVLVPRLAGLDVTAISFADHKWPWLRRESGRRLVLRVSVGRRTNTSWIALDDHSLLDRAVADCSTVLGLDPSRFDTTSAIVTRWRDALPQYDVGHHERVSVVESAAEQTPGLAMTGAWHRGLGLPACVGAAQRAAASLLD